MQRWTDVGIQGKWRKEGEQGKSTQTLDVRKVQSGRPSGSEKAEKQGERRAKGSAFAMDRHGLETPATSPEIEGTKKCGASSE